MKFLASLAVLGLTVALVNAWLGIFENKDVGYALGFAIIFGGAFIHDLVKARARGLTVFQYWKLPRDQG